jgi:ABC-type protease/lipase transport system fused ATPase/permease subunit
MEVLIPIFAISFVFGSLMYVAYVVLEAIRSRQHARLTSEFNHKLLDKVSSAQELSTLLNSDSGAKLLSSLQGWTRSTTPQARILRAIQSGLVLATLGIGLFMFAFWNPTLPREASDTVILFATVATSVGVGLLLSAGASYAISRRMGILSTPDDARHAGRSVAV